jgi:hypothetical protein
MIEVISMGGVDFATIWKYPSQSDYQQWTRAIAPLLPTSELATPFPSSLEGDKETLPGNLYGRVSPLHSSSHADSVQFEMTMDVDVATLLRWLVFCMAAFALLFFLLVVCDL